MEIRANVVYRIPGKSTVIGWLPQSNMEGQAPLLLEIRRAGDQHQTQRKYKTFADWLAAVGATEVEIESGTRTLAPEAQFKRNSEMSGQDVAIVAECMRMAGLSLEAKDRVKAHLVVKKADGSLVPLWCNKKRLQNFHAEGATFGDVGLRYEFQIYGLDKKEGRYNLLYDRLRGFMKGDLAGTAGVPAVSKQ